LRAHALALIELTDPKRRGRLPVPKTSQATPSTAGNIVVVVLDQARLTPGVPALNGRPVVVAAAWQKLVPGTTMTPLQASFGTPWLVRGYRLPS